MDPSLAVPQLTMTAEGLHLLSLDSRAAYLLSLVDGECTLGTILELCDMDQDEALDILERLVGLGAIALGSQSMSQAR
jgi:hypothetical protein